MRSTQFKSQLTNAIGKLLLRAPIDDPHADSDGFTIKVTLPTGLLLDVVDVSVVNDEIIIRTGVVKNEDDKSYFTTPSSSTLL